MRIRNFVAAGALIVPAFAMAQMTPTTPSAPPTQDQTTTAPGTTTDSMTPQTGKKAKKSRGSKSGDMTTPPADTTTPAPADPMTTPSTTPTDPMAPTGTAPAPAPTPTPQAR